jgi:hypothetical protein
MGTGAHHFSNEAAVEYRYWINGQSPQQAGTSNVKEHSHIAYC